MYELSGFRFTLGYIHDYAEGHTRSGEIMHNATYSGEGINSDLFGLSPSDVSKGPDGVHGLSRGFKDACSVLQGKWAVGNSQACMYVDAGASSVAKKGRLLKIAVRSGTHFKEGGTIRGRNDADLEEIHILDQDQVVDRHRAFMAIYVPDNGEFGLAVIGSYKGNNIDSLAKSFTAQIVTSLNRKRIRIRFEKELTRERLRKFIKGGNVHGIELIRKGVSDNKVKEVLGRKVDFRKANIGVKVTFQGAGTNWLIKKYDDWRNGTQVTAGRYFMSDGLEQVGLGEGEPVQEKIVVKHDGKQVTRSLADFFRSAPSVTVERVNLKFDNDGAVTYDSLSKQIVLYLDELTADLLT